MACMAQPGSTSTVSVDGRVLKLSNLDKVLFPAVGYTKAEVIHYYAEIAATLLPHLTDRALCGWAAVGFP